MDAVNDVLEQYGEVVAPVSAYEAPDEAAPPLDYPWDVGVGPGWHYDVPMPEYLGWPVVSSSLAMLLTHHQDRTPAYLRWATLNVEESERTGAALLGTLAHSVVLEPETVEGEYVVEPYPDPAVYTKADGTPSSNPKATSQWKDMIAELEATGKQIVSADQYDAAQEIYEAVHRHPRASQLVEAPGPVEASGVARDPKTGLLLKIRPDKLIPAAGYHVNLKTAANASRETFMRDVYRYGYYVQAAFYERALRALGFDHRRSLFLVMETAGDKQVAVYEVDTGTLDAGHQVLDRALERIAACAAQDDWPGHSPDIEPLSLPHWAWAKVDEALMADFTESDYGGE